LEEEEDDDDGADVVDRFAPPWETKKELNLDQQPTKSKIGRARLAPLPFFVAGKDEEYEGDASGEQKCRKKKNRKPSQPPVALK
jgi:hypothetical protein